MIITNSYFYYYSGSVKSSQVKESQYTASTTKTMRGKRGLGTRKGGVVLNGMDLSVTTRERLRERKAKDKYKG